MNSQADTRHHDALFEARPLYFLPQDDLAGEVLIPAFAEATAARCMVGFFSSGVLADLAPGLATFIAKPSGTFRLIISPYLSQADQEALEAGLTDPASLAAGILVAGLVTESAIQRHTLKCLSYLLAVGRVEVRIALMRRALFHPKVWLFDVSHGVIAVHGSSNMTHAGIQRNYEQVSVSKSWDDPTQRYIIDKLSGQFDRLWTNSDADCVVLDLPEAARASILCTYPVSEPPAEIDYWELYHKATEVAPPIKEAPELELPTRPTLISPSWVHPDEGAFAHQGEAVRAWVGAGYRGTLEMATGSGKTITALLGASHLVTECGSLLIVVAAPYVPLIEQWCGEVRLFGVSPTNLTTVGGAQARQRALKQSHRRLRLGVSRVEIVVVSHDTLCTPEFADVLRAIDVPRLLIADEAHNLGRSSFVSKPPLFFEYRLALSATPVRQYDEEGTDAILGFFGPVVYQFTLKDAIGRCLVEYDYYVHEVDLTPSELDEWRHLTEQIRINYWRQESGRPDEYLAKLYRDRRAIQETAQDKIAMLAALLDREDLASLRHTLIYATDKSPEQLREVNKLLQSRGILFHQLTSEETANRQLTAQIIRSFQDGEIQVLTAKRVLDEGVNIPQICRAYILASNTVERQWIQRRGRLLRTCPEIGKTHAIVHDFLALPPSLHLGVDDDERGLIRAELRRALEFASLARNAGRPDGPLAVLHRLTSAAFT